MIIQFLCFLNMNKKDLVKQLDKTVLNYKNLDLVFDQANDLGIFPSEGHFFDTVWKSFEGLIEVIEKQLDTDWISWYIFDNQCGEKELRGQTGSMKKPKTIKNTKELAQLILEDIKDKEFGKYPFK